MSYLSTFLTVLFVEEKTAILMDIIEVHVAIYLAGCFALYLMLMTKVVNT